MLTMPKPIDEERTPMRRTIDDVLTVVNRMLFGTETLS